MASEFGVKRDPLMKKTMDTRPQRRQAKAEPAEILAGYFLSITNREIL